MTYSLLISLREGLEAGLIVAIILSYLTRIDARPYFRPVLLGAALAFAGSVALGAGLELTATSLPGRATDAFEGLAMLFAVAVLTWMIFWMRRQAVSIGRNLRAKIDVALRAGSGFTLVLLAFSAVAREGLETVLFLFAGSSSAESALLYWAGVGLGLAAAAALAWAIYAGSARLPLGPFFNVTGILLIVLSAGMLVNGMVELSEVGYLPSLGAHVWDTYAWVPDNSDTGRFLHTIFGYQSSPYLWQVVAYVAYLVPTLLLFTVRLPGRGGRQLRPRGTVTAAATAEVRE